jgi:exodeoxyribonuclease VII large subunit
MPSDFDDDDLEDDLDEFEDEFDNEVLLTYSISELADAINEVLNDNFDSGLWVWGEISGLSKKGPHTYFTLVEQTPDGKRNQLNVNLWGGEMTKMRPILMKSGLDLVNGVKVRIYGNLDFYAGFGKLSMIMRGIDPNYTLGEIALQREELIRKLKEMGVFDLNREVEISPAPLRLGVITSGTSAAWADFKNQVESSDIGFHLHLANVSVQGDNAVREITQAISRLSQREDLDALVLIRGGGSKAELSTFDAESIALAITESSLPVFTGIGHEIDRHVADDVAFEAHKTPTACAVALIGRVNNFINETEANWDAIARLATQQLADSTNRLNNVAREIGIHTRTAVERADERLGDRIARLTRRGPQLIGDLNTRIDNFESRVRLLDPKNVLARGWSITRGADGKIVRNVGDVTTGEILTTVLHDGNVTSTVN